jgi:hypothetical protein
MHRRDLLRAIARTTGDSISTIKRLGFHLEVVRLQPGKLKYRYPSPGLRNHRVKVKADTHWECADE